MMFTEIFFPVIIFIIASVGVLYNKNTILVTLMCLELMLLAANILIVFASVALDNSFGLVFAIILLSVGAAETAIGLCLVVSFYHNRSNYHMNARMRKARSR